MNLTPILAEESLSSVTVTIDASLQGLLELSASLPTRIQCPFPKIGGFKCEGEGRKRCIHYPHAHGNRVVNNNYLHVCVFSVVN